MAVPGVWAGAGVRQSTGREATCGLGKTLFTPTYTAQMGHWSEGLVEQVTQQVGDKLDPGLIRHIALQAGLEIETLSGRAFHPPRRSTSNFEPNGMPFVDVPDMNLGSMESARKVWAIANPANPGFANVLQLLPLDTPRLRNELVPTWFLRVGGA